jgi:hypothetical protein
MLQPFIEKILQNIEFAYRLQGCMLYQAAAINS